MVLDNDSVESSVARGAAYYGLVRRGTGLRVGAGSARTYYIGLRSDDSLEGICVLPAGVNEGTTLPLLEREFSVLANRQVSFTLFSSRTRHDLHGEVVALDEADIDHHPPLVTVLRYGRRLRERRLSALLRATFTELAPWSYGLNRETLRIAGDCNLNSAAKRNMRNNKTRRNHSLLRRVHLAMPTPIPRSNLP